MVGKVMSPLPALAQDLGTHFKTAGVFELFGLEEGQLGRQVQPGDPGQVQGGVLGGVLDGVQGEEQAGVQVGVQHQLEQGQAGVQPAERGTGLA